MEIKILRDYLNSKEIDKVSGFQEPSMNFVTGLNLNRYTASKSTTCCVRLIKNNRQETTSYKYTNFATKRETETLQIFSYVPTKSFVN